VSEPRCPGCDHAMHHGEGWCPGCPCPINGMPPGPKPPKPEAPEAEVLADEILRTAFLHEDRSTGVRRVVGFERGRLIEVTSTFLLRRDEQQRVAYDQRVKQLQAEWGKDHNELEALRERVKLADGAIKAAMLQHRCWHKNGVPARPYEGTNCVACSAARAYREEGKATK
jgi:hypothetical protein